MSTRGLLGIVVNGEEKLSYNHYDSYPGGLGLDTLRALRDHIASKNMALVKQEAVQVNAIYGGIDDVEPHDYQGRVIPPDELEGDLVLFLVNGMMAATTSQWPRDSLFCEWGYIADFDAGTFEVYRGFQKSEHKAGRFAGPANGNGYYPIALLKSWPLSKLPSDDEFTKAFEDPEEETDPSRAGEPPF